MIGNNIKLLPDDINPINEDHTQKTQFSIIKQDTKP